MQHTNINGWIKHDGLGVPDAVRKMGGSQFVEVDLRSTDRTALEKSVATLVEWKHTGAEGDIYAYRICDHEPVTIDIEAERLAGDMQGAADTISRMRAEIERLERANENYLYCIRQQSKVIHDYDNGIAPVSWKPPKRDWVMSGPEALAALGGVNMMPKRYLSDLDGVDPGFSAEYWAELHEPGEIAPCEAPQQPFKRWLGDGDALAAGLAIHRSIDIASGPDETVCIDVEALAHPKVSMIDVPATQEAENWVEELLPLKVRAEDISISEYHSTPRGSFSSKPADGVSVRHKPTGKLFGSHEGRNQHRNRYLAMTALRDYLLSRIGVGIDSEGGSHD